MPNFTAHFGVAGLVGLGAGLWTVQAGFAPPTAVLAAGAALTSGLAPDLDADQSRPLKIAAALTGLAVALITLEGLTGQGWPFRWPGSENLHRPWPATPALLAAAAGYFIFNSLARTLFCRFTRHRGLFHSLAMPVLAGGLWALALAGRGRPVSLLVGLAAAAGVLSHLLLDALFSRSLNPLKLYSANKLQSLLLWLFSAGLLLAWLARTAPVEPDFRHLFL